MAPTIMEERTLGGTAQGVLTDSKNLAKEASPLQAALSNQYAQIDKLNMLLIDLNDRLTPVRDQMPVRENELADDTPASPVVNQVRNSTARIQALQSLVQGLLSELQV